MRIWQAFALAVGLTALPMSAQATGPGDYQGDFMVRAGVSVVAPDSSADVSIGGVLVPGIDADVSTEVIPSLTLTYFFTNNVAVELFCCFARHEVEGKGLIEGVDLGDTWIFPPAVTLQYHFDSMNGFKPYVGAGVQYIHFFDESTASGLGGAQLEIEDSFGFTLQAGVDIEMGGGWYINADVKKTWFDMDADWSIGGITPVEADVTLDPLIATLGVGYRFNLFSHEPAPFK